MPTNPPATTTETSVPSVNSTTCPANDNATAPISCLFTDTPVGTATQGELSVNSFTSRVNLDSGLNPAKVSATLFDASGQIIYNTSLNSDGTYQLKAPNGTYTLQLSAPGYLSAEKVVILAADQPFNLTEITLLVGDVNGDHEINALDLISLGAEYENGSSQLATADLNGDGLVDLFDLTLLAKNWRKISPTDW